MVMFIDLVIHNIFATLSLAVDSMTEIQFMASKEVLCLDIIFIPPLKSAHFLALVDIFIFCESRQPDCNVEGPHTCVLIALF